MALLEIRGVSKSFDRNGENGAGRPLPVLRDVDLAIDERQFVCIVGRSGSGKTTLISLIAGLLAPDRGEILLEGKSIEGPGPDRGIVFQNYSLLPWLSVFENAYLAVDAVSPGLSVEEKIERTQRYVALVNLRDAPNKRPRELSAGMRQRVGIARAFALQPKVLLLDEPFSLLDVVTRMELQDELMRIWESERKTVLMVTHDVDEALLLADRIVMMTNGPAATVGERSSRGSRASWAFRKPSLTSPPSRFSPNLPS
jgi:nitrate/nitrite transport system ATP-binding protein